MDEYTTAEQTAASITLGTLWNTVVADRRVVWIVTGCAVTLALLVAVFGTPQYDASIQLAPPSSMVDGGGLGELASQSYGLVALSAGLGLGERQNTDQTLVILQSEGFLRHFIDVEGVAPVLYAHQWDPVTKSWRRDRSLWARISAAAQALRTWLSPEDFKTAPPDGAPDPWQVYRRFAQMVSTETDKRTHIVTLTVRWNNPVIAAAWANDLVRRLNAEARARAVNDVNADLAYVAEQLNRTQVFELRQALYHIAESEQKHAMVANTREELAFRVLAKAEIPHERAFPKRRLLVLGGLVGGLILGVFIAIARGLLWGSLRTAGTALSN